MGIRDTLMGWWGWGRREEEKVEREEKGEKGEKGERGERCPPGAGHLTCLVNYSTSVQDIG